MQVNEFLRQVENAKIVSARQLQQMYEIAGNSKIEQNTGVFSELDQASFSGEVQIGNDNENPRLVRGFHDVLITIGIVAALSGLGAVAGPWAVLFAVLIFAEIFVRRQNLALPAFVLTMILVGSSMGGLSEMITREADRGGAILGFGFMLILLGAFYWRYRIPIALASLISVGFLIVFSVLLYFLQVQYGAEIKFFENNANLIGGIGLFLTVCLFAVAMGFDSKDINRVTRRSDVAFWLHLIIAPLLMYSLFLTIFGNSGFWWARNPTGGDAVIALCVVSFLMIVGIVIDRRAFVTSGLISLGVALFILTKDSGVTASNLSAMSLLAVGIIVLLLGTGWQWLRGIVLRLLPTNVRANLPPV